jgi:hypothetical protein
MSNDDFRKLISKWVFENIILILLDIHMK